MNSDLRASPVSQLPLDGVETAHGGLAIAKARKALGLSLDELSTKLKVNVRKLEQIERGDFNEITGGDAHIRGLVRAMCKAVGITPEPVLAQVRLHAQTDPLEEIHDRYAAPFTSSGRMGKLGTGAPTRRTTGVVMSPATPRISNSWIVGAILAVLAAGLLYAWPTIEPRATQLWGMLGETIAARTATPATQTSTENKDSASTATNNSPVTTSPEPAAPLTVSTALAAIPAVPPASEPAASPVAASAIDAEKLTIEASASTWIEVRNAAGALLVSRNLSAGERLEQGLENRRFVVIGNANGAQVWVRGKPLDVTNRMRNNVARFEVQ